MDAEFVADETTVFTSSALTIAETAGMKKEAGTEYFSSRPRMRGMPAREPYWPRLIVPKDMPPFFSSIVS